MARCSPPEEEASSPLRPSIDDEDPDVRLSVDDEQPYAASPPGGTPRAKSSVSVTPLDVPSFTSSDFNHPGSPPPSFKSVAVVRNSFATASQFSADESRGKYTFQFTTSGDLAPKKVVTKADRKAAAATLPSGELEFENLSARSEISKLQKQQIPEFVYMHDFDTCGIIYYLGTNRFANTWVNPALLGIVELSSSEMNQDSQPLHAFIGRDPVRSLLANISNSWFTVDFKDHVVVPRYYSLRHYISQDSHAMRSWRLDGSVDGETWEFIKIHKNDKALNKKGATHTWSVDTYNIMKHASKAYRMFRIQMTGENSSDYFHNLCCSGFEVYGFLYERGDLKADEDGELWMETPLPIEEASGNIIHLTEQEISIGEKMLKESELKFKECELFQNEFVVTNVDDLIKKNEGEEGKRGRERGASAGGMMHIAQMQDGETTEGLGIRFLEFESPDISDEMLRDHLRKTPTKKILRDPKLGYKKNKNHIKFADELDLRGMDSSEKPDLLTVVWVDLEMCHHSETRGRKCPNAARTILGDRD